MNYINLMDTEQKVFYQIKLDELVMQYIGIYKSTIGMQKTNEVYVLLQTLIEFDWTNNDINQLQTLQEFCIKVNSIMSQNTTEDYIPYILMVSDYKFKTNAKHYVNGVEYIKQNRPKSFNNLIYIENSYPNLKQFVLDVKNNLKNDITLLPDLHELKRLIKY